MVEKHAKKLQKRGAAWRLRAELIAGQAPSKKSEAYAKSALWKKAKSTRRNRGVASWPRCRWPAHYQHYRYPAPHYRFGKDLDAAHHQRRSIRSGT